ncbi:UNVERIFIED_CONTAM: hypothetical protein FKN15_065222 [Acipenser sinensis]
MSWMREFIQLAGRVVLPYSSGILTAVLPCLSFDDRKKSILQGRGTGRQGGLVIGADGLGGSVPYWLELRDWEAGYPSTKEVANACNHSLMKLVTPEDDVEEAGEGSELPQQDNTPPRTQDTLDNSLNASQDSVGFSNISFFTLASPDRAQVTLDLDGIVQVLDRHLHDPATGMMTRITVLKWLYHLYIKTPRKVILKDLEVLAEIASSPAGQTDAPGSCDSSDSKSELQVPGSTKSVQPSGFGFKQEESSEEPSQDIRLGGEKNKPQCTADTIERAKYPDSEREDCASDHT